MSNKDTNEYLMPSQYKEIAINTIGLNVEQTANYFKSKFCLHKDHNPDFKNELAAAIVGLDNVLEDKVAFVRAAAYEKYKNINIDWDSYSYPMNHLKSLNKETIGTIVEGYNLFKEKIKE